MWAQRATRFAALTLAAALVLPLPPLHAWRLGPGPKANAGPKLHRREPAAPPRPGWLPPLPPLGGAARQLASAGLALQLMLAAAAPAAALTEAQVLVDSVWKEVDRQFVDGTFNGLGEEGWRKERLSTIRAVADAGDEEATYAAIRGMLAKLGDPYTRFLTPPQYEALAAVATGRSAGVGVALQADPGTHDMTVLSTVPKAPADRGGLRPGDIIIAVDGAPAAGDTAEVVAARMRGPSGSTVTVQFRHAGATGKGAEQEVMLTRAEVAVSPLQSGVATLPDKRRAAVIKIPSFSKDTPGQLADALRGAQRVDAIVIDLRGNAGGYMPAGVDGAKLFLRPGAEIISEVNRAGKQRAYISDGVGADVDTPLYVIVDQRTASAAEIFAAGLQDNGRARIVGATRSFGKGKIQNVQPLADGGAVSVTKAKYLTPSGKNINGVGIGPDTLRSDAQCGAASAVDECMDGVL